MPPAMKPSLAASMCYGGWRNLAHTCCCQRLARLHFGLREMLNSQE
jgi:hypothetical protein